MSAPVRIQNGMNGVEFGIADTDPRAGNFGAIYLNTDTEFDVLEGNVTGGTGYVHTAPKWLYGLFTEVQAASGNYDLYNA